MSESGNAYERTIPSKNPDLPLTVQRLRELLAPLDGDLVVRAYEGEGVGIVIETPERPRKEIAWFDTDTG